MELSDLDPADRTHLSAIHEAGHAVAIDRTGCALTHLRLLEVSEGRTHGDTGRGDLADLPETEVARRDRAISLAGPEAERLFAGEVDDEQCAEDEHTANEATEFLGDELQNARSSVVAALADEHTWLAVRLTACTLLDSGGEVMNIQTLQGLIRGGLGPPSSSWPEPD